MFIKDSSYSERFAEGENLMSPSLNFYHNKPFWGKFIPDATSNNVAPRLKISAF